MLIKDGKKSFKKTRILIADDNNLFREITKKIILGTSDMVVTGEVVEAREIFSNIENGDFDLIVLNTLISGKSGYEVLREVKARRPLFPVLMLSSFFEYIYERSAFKDGADGYIIKYRIADELISAIRVIMNGGKYFNQISQEGLALKGL